MARCCDCRNFIPDRVGDGFGLGQCQIMNWVKEHQPEHLERWFKKLGGQLFWGGHGHDRDRLCEKFSLSERSLG